MSYQITFTREDIYFLDPSTNSQFYEILDESNYIMKKYSEILLRLKNTKIPKSFDTEYLLRPEVRFRAIQRELNKIGKEITELDLKYLVPFNNKAGNFALKPNLVLLDRLTEIERLTVTSHYVNFIRYRICTAPL